MDYRADLRLIHFRSVQTMVYGEKMMARQLVGPLDQEIVIPARLERGTRPTAVVGPQTSGAQIAMELGPDLPHRDAIIRRFALRLAGHASHLGAARHRRDWQRIHKTRKVKGIESRDNLCGRQWRNRQHAGGLKKASSADSQIECFQRRK